MRDAIYTGHQNERRQKTIVFLTALFLLFVYKGNLELFFNNCLFSISFPYDMDYGEGPILNQVVKLSRFENIYQPDLNHAPYTITNYPPVFVALQVPFMWLFGPQFWYGRVISVLGIIAASLFCGLIIYTLTRNKIAAVFAALTLLAMPYIIEWAPTNRVDSLALGLSLAGLYVVARCPEDRGKIFWAAVLFVLAAYTKHTYAFVGPFSALVWLLSHRKWKNALIFFSWVVGLGFCMFFLLTIITHGGFYTHVITANNNAYYWERTGLYFNELFTYFWPFLGIGALMLTALLHRRIRCKFFWLLGPYFLAAVLISFAIGKEGAYVNYLLELSAAFSLLTGAWLAIPMQEQRNRYWLQAAFLLMLIPPIVSAQTLTEANYIDRVQNRVNKASEVKRLYEFVKGIDDVVLLDEFMGFMPMLNRPLYYQPFEWKMLADDGHWNESSFLKEIEEKAFAAIIIYSPQWALGGYGRWTEAQAKKIRENYKKKTIIANCAIFVPVEK